MEKRYMISDAAKLVDVEAHVLRYWEEELDIEIPRNEMGHRYYTDKLITLFKAIKDLKEQGFLLKAIKMLMPELTDGRAVTAADIKHITEGYIHNAPYSEQSAEQPESNQNSRHNQQEQTLYNEEGRQAYPNEVMANSNSQSSATDTQSTSLPSKDASPEVVKTNKMEQFQLILGNIVAKALQENNDSLGKSVSTQVSDSVIKQMDYLLRIQEEHEEERYKKLDETIRNYQLAKKEIAASQSKKRLKLFKKSPKITK